MIDAGADLFAMKKRCRIMLVNASKFAHSKQIHSNGATALHAASEHGNVHAIEALAMNGGNVNQIDR